MTVQIIEFAITALFTAALAVLIYISNKED